LQGDSLRSLCVSAPLRQGWRRYEQILRSSSVTVTPAGDDETLVAVRAMRGKNGFAATPAAEDREGCVEDKGPEQQDAAALCQRLRNCSGVMPACLRIARNVPSGISPG
jgi:hypothetical protein